MDARSLGTKAKNVVRGAATMNQAIVFDALELAKLIQSGRQNEAMELLKVLAERAVWAHQALLYLAADCLQEAEETLIDAKMRQEGRKSA